MHGGQHGVYMDLLQRQLPEPSSPACHCAYHCAATSTGLGGRNPEMRDRGFAIQLMMQNWTKVVMPLVARNWAIYRPNTPLLTSDDPVVIIGGPSADRRIRRGRLLRLSGSLPRQGHIAWLRGAYEVGRGDDMIGRALTPSTVPLDALETVWLTTTQGGPLWASSSG